MLRYISIHRTISKYALDAEETTGAAFVTYNNIICAIDVADKYGVIQ
jgi:hypothetical protein